MASEAQQKINRRLYKTPISHTPRVGEPFWTQDGQGYVLDYHRGGVVKLNREDNPAPEGYLENKRKEREKEARSFGGKK